MRVSLAVLLASTMLSSAALAQVASPFGAPSAPLTAEELSAIKAEGAERRAAIKAAAERAREKREEEAAEAEAAKAAAEAPAPTPLREATPTPTQEAPVANELIQDIPSEIAPSLEAAPTSETVPATDPAITPAAPLAAPEGMVPPSEEGMPALPEQK